MVILAHVCLHVVFLQYFSSNVHYLNNSIYLWNCCNQAQFLDKKVIMKCLAIKIFAWIFLRFPIHCYNRKIWVDIPSYIIFPWPDKHERSVRNYENKDSTDQICFLFLLDQLCVPKNLSIPEGALPASSTQFALAWQPTKLLSPTLPY